MVMVDVLGKEVLVHILVEDAYLGRVEALLGLSELGVIVLPKAYDALLLHWVEEVHASRWPVEFFVSCAFQHHTGLGVIADADVAKRLDLRCVLELDRDALHFWDLNQRASHHIKDRLVAFNGLLHCVPLLLGDALQVVEVLQQMEIVALLQDFLLLFEGADGLAVLEDLADLDAVLLGSLVAHSVDAEMKLKPEQLLL